MRDSKLNNLFASILSLKGVGEKSSQLLEKLGITKPVHFLWHLPNSIVIRKVYNTLDAIPINTVATISIKITEHKAPPRYGNSPYKIYGIDSKNNQIIITYFHAHGDYLSKLYKIGENIYISGNIEVYKKSFQITHPDYSSKNIDDIPSLEKKYPLTSGISNKMIQKWIKSALEITPNISEWQDKSLVKSKNWLSFNDSLAKVHNATQEVDLLPTSKPIERLAYDELLAEQLALFLNRKHHSKNISVPIEKTNKIAKLLLKALPFSLTNSQINSIKEIQEDMLKPMQMLRLLQGDVGSGKTLVALFSALNVVENGGQVAFMAPTDILARQHYLTITKYLEGLNVRVSFLSGKEKQKSKNDVLNKLENGEVDILIGTHSIFQDKVQFKNLQFVVIDEQHRFGVHQRLRLTQKGKNPHLLVMTATPIPRTLILAMYGDMDLTTITEKPKGRKDIDTRILSQEKINELVARLEIIVKKGEKVFWVCPLIEESEKIDLIASEERFKFLKTKLKNVEIQLIHGKMSVEEKNNIMDSFKNNKKGAILVATTVIEVGIDVPDSNIIVIEHAERFGLSQLHQLRGRVGRGDKEAVCILLYGKEIGETGMERLKVMKKTNDGFIIAEEDLKIRGGGDLLGVRQSGMQTFKIANLFYHADLLKIARDDCKLILNKDPYLESERGINLKTLLYLFEKEEAIILLSSG